MSKIVYTDDTAKTPSVSKAIEQLTEAYDSGDASRIESALECANATIKEHNRILRKEYYLSKIIATDIPATRKAIVEGGYIKQLKLKNKANGGNRVIVADEAEAQVNVLEVNQLVRADIFGDDIAYITKKFRDAVVAYVASEMDKSADVLEGIFGYSTMKHLANNKTSMNNMRDLLQNAADQIVFYGDGDKNTILMTKADVRTISYWIANKTTRYGTKFGSTDAVLQMITDIIWAKLNNVELTCKSDKEIF